MKKYKIAFIKFGGLSAGGTERWLQTMAANIDRSKFDIDYFYCDSAPYVNSDYKAPDTDIYRKKYMEKHKVNLIKFHVSAKDITKPNHPWIDTDFWEVFDESKYDLIQTAKAGHPEYPFTEMNNKVVEYITLSGMVDNSKNIVKSISLSYWTKNKWLQLGGNPKKADVVYIPVEEPCTKETYNKELKIPKDAIVCGFHQRNDNFIFSRIQLDAIKKLNNSNIHIIIFGGGDNYKIQAKKIKLKNINFLPHTGDSKIISKFLNTLDIYTHGRSDGETFGTVLAEAMIHGKPCISHYVKHGANAMEETIGPAGYVVSSVDEYVLILKKMINDKKLRISLGYAGLMYARANYSISKTTKKLENIWIDLLKKDIISTKFKENENIKIGKTKFNFFYAGDFNNKSEIAYSFVKQKRIPEKEDVSIFSAFIPYISSFIDVGSNTGIYSVIASALGGGRINTYAIEPQKSCCMCLNKTIDANNWSERFHVSNIGLADKPGKLKLHLSGTGSTFDNEFNDNCELPLETVTVDTLDSFVKKNDIDYIDFIKIDVEGFEFSVLKGANQTITKYKPALFIEIADNIKGRNYKNKFYSETLDWLRDKGYEIYRCEGKKVLYKLEKNEPYGHIAMYLCVNQNHQRALDRLNTEIKNKHLLKLPTCLAKEQKELYPSKVLPIIYKTKQFYKKIRY